MDWSAQQEKALAAVADWIADSGGPQLFRLFGYAGTGKTTLAR
ncbi:MAG: ATP-binding protein, partial [Xanthobacteraceae bacterium]|nr:ATP-binding protein [Xanthobacteraceae bacterium]